MPSSSLVPRSVLQLCAALAMLAAAPVARTAELGRAADNRIYAQRLVNEVAQAHPTLMLVGIHAIAPGASAPAMVACTLDRIGKVDSADDISAAKDHKIICAGTLKQSKYVVLLPLKDAHGDYTGAALGLAFPFHAGDDEPQFYLQAVAIAAALGQRLPSAAALFNPIDAP
jgi:hypothetical protein